jgi:hypothetical protein
VDEHYEAQLRAAREQLEHRRGLGDRLDMPRPIEHFANFPRKSDAVSAAAELEAAGYRTTLSRWRVFGAALEATRPSTLDAETVEAFTEEILQIVVGNGGAYDGWGGEVIESTDAPSAED